jgi:hypothetical protein
LPTVWVSGPGQEPWEVYVVKGDSATYGTDPELIAAGCCTDNSADEATAKATTSTGCCG